MKKLISAIITLAVLLGLTWFVSDYMEAKPIDYAFIVGCIVTIFVGLFTSQSSFLSNNMKLSVQGQTGIKVEESSVPTSGNSFAFLVSLLYTIVSLIITVIYYWNEF